MLVRRQLLYVEDDRLSALLFEQAMSQHADFDVHVAEDGPQALEIAGRVALDVLVLDSHLPGISGHALLAQLRTLPALADLPAFMCSADAQPEDLQRALDAGFRDYWTKPLDIRRVIADLAALRQR